MVRVDAEDIKIDVRGRVYAKVTRIAVSVDDYCLKVCHQVFCNSRPPNNRYDWLEALVVVAPRSA